MRLFRPQSVSKWEGEMHRRRLGKDHKQRRPRSLALLIDRSFDEIESTASPRLSFPLPTRGRLSTVAFSASPATTSSSTFPLPLRSFFAPLSLFSSPQRLEVFDTLQTLLVTPACPSNTQGLRLAVLFTCRSPWIFVSSARLDLLTSQT
ncbi:uncharacterized protein APUU_10412A [Aspergillus puulaauensis]|uniref:Uncharacterized protein n=1 Tax=Aspergillus puulaauensis TaxID=1220207 RepID=A0A7R7XA80_9EURO|nr:uncharacterized protein APUU_10412A [Aspergillus puulaauensis]BCS17584.1 hypothetical protein APUU_10412A [Aspergillus puulaauensis]